MNRSDEITLSIETWVTDVEQSLWTLVEVDISTTIPVRISEKQILSQKAEATAKV